MFWIELLKYIFLGIVQGLTEVLPISSSRHVALAQLILNIQQPHGILFLILVNTGSLIAILIHFRKMIKRIVVHTIQYLFGKEKLPEMKEDFHYGVKIIIASIPTAIVGILLKDVLENLYSDYTLFVVGIGLLITSTILYVVRIAPAQHVTQKLTYKNALVIGCIQPFAILPGLSRSGLTTSTGLLRRVSMDTALSFSLMLYIPISIGPILYYFYQWIQDPAVFTVGFDVTDPQQYIYYFFAFAMSIVGTLFALKKIFLWFRKGKLIIFSVYTMVLGIIAIIAAMFTS